MLEKIEAGQLTHLPLSRRPRPTPTGVPAPVSKPGLLKRLLGLGGSSRPLPRPQPPEEYCFLEKEEDEWYDFPGVIDGLAAIYASLPVSDPNQRKALILRLCKMPVTNYATTEHLVLLAAQLAETPADRVAFLADLRQWGRGADDPQASMLAMVLADAHPDWRAELLALLVHTEAVMDWTNWSHSREAVPESQLTPLVKMMREAPEAQLGWWLKLFARVPVPLLLPGLVRALFCEDPTLVLAALERLRSDGRPLPDLQAEPRETESPLGHRECDSQGS